MQKDSFNVVFMIILARYFHVVFNGDFYFCHMRYWYQLKVDRKMQLHNNSKGCLITFC
jgi:hypothetical protein